MVEDARKSSKLKGRKERIAKAAATMKAMKTAMKAKKVKKLKLKVITIPKLKKTCPMRAKRVAAWVKIELDEWLKRV